MLNKKNNQPSNPNFNCEHITDGIIQLDNQWRIVCLNPGAERIVARKQKEKLEGKLIWDIFEKEHLPAAQKFFNKAKSEQATTKFEYFNKHLKRWFETRVYPHKEGLDAYIIDITDKKNDEQALIESKARLKKITSVLGEGVYVLNNKGELTFLNPAAEKLLGWSQSELLGRQAHPIIHEKPGFHKEHKNECKVLNVIKTGRSYKIEDDIFFKKNGESFNVAYTSTPIKENGKVIASVTAFQDITKRKEVEEKNKYLASFPELNPHAIIEIDFKGNVTYMNPVAKKHFPDLSEKGLNHPLLSGDHLFISAIKKQKTIVRDVTFNNTTYSQTIRAVPEEEKIRIFTQDITERKKTEEALRQSEERFRKVFEEGPLGVILLNKNNRIVNVNSTYSKMTGYSKKELTNKTFVDFTYPEDIPLSVKTTKELFSGEIQKVNIEQRYIKKSGEIIWVNLITSLIKDEKNNVLYALSMLEDITERKKSEKKLKHAYETEHKIATTLQKSLLPTDIPVIKDLEVKFYYQSASEMAEVGGDFYDFFETITGKYGIVVGDVEGKGIDAAAETAKVKYLLKDRALTGLPPEDVLSNINTALFKQKTRPFTALTYLVYDPKTSVLKVSNAGNPYPYYVDGDTFVEITGVPVSILPKQYYPSYEIKMNKGDSVLAYTDGLIEPRNNSDIYGEERVRLFVKKNKKLPGDLLLKGLINEAREFSKNNLKDDILVVYLRRKI